MFPTKLQNMFDSKDKRLSYFEIFQDISVASIKFLLKDIERAGP